MAIIVALHAHPDDEVLLTGGTIARLAAEGHPVIIVMATSGEIWPDQHRGRRLEELRASAAILYQETACQGSVASLNPKPWPKSGQRAPGQDPDAGEGDLHELRAEPGPDDDIAPGAADHGSSPSRSPCHRRGGCLVSG